MVTNDHGKWHRLQLELNDKIVTLRVHACNDCDFIEYSDVLGERIDETALSENFVSALSEMIVSGKNRSMSSFVPEAIAALGQYRN